MQPRAPQLSLHAPKYPHGGEKHPNWYYATVTQDYKWFHKGDRLILDASKTLGQSNFVWIVAWAAQGYGWNWSNVWPFNTQWIPPSHVAFGQPATGFAGLGADLCAAVNIVGLGAPLDDVAAALKLPAFSLNPYALIRQFWAQVQGRSWDQAMTSANARAMSKKWIASDLPSKDDFITLLVSTAVNGKMAKDKNIGASPTDNPTDTLSRTLYILAQRRGIKTPTPGDVEQMKNSSTGNIEVLIPVLIVAVIAQAIAIMVVAVALIYFSSLVIDDVLSKIECDRELMRLHADYNRIVDRHIQNPNAPWTSDEIKARDALLESQKFVAAGCTKPKTGPEIPWGWWALGGTAITAGVLGVVYKDEIKQWFASRRAK
jgi:hypothetical protein